MSVRVRFAPSPTGPLHMGGVRTALYNYLFARKHGGQFLLRIEDTDQGRYVPGAEQYIKEALAWCGMVPDEGPWNGGPDAPYRQSDRKDLYRAVCRTLGGGRQSLLRLRYAGGTGGHARPAEGGRCSRPRLQRGYARAHEEQPYAEHRDKGTLARGDEHVVRLKVPRNAEVRFEDIIRGWVVVHSANIDDKVLFKGDGMPTYHLANIVDDHLMRDHPRDPRRGMAAQRTAARVALRSIRLGAPRLSPTSR
jgi:glutamyl-tRNA synthetase